MHRRAPSGGAAASASAVPSGFAGASSSAAHKQPPPPPQQQQQQVLSPAQSLSAHLGGVGAHSTPEENAQATEAAVRFLQQKLDSVDKLSRLAKLRSELAEQMERLESELRTRVGRRLDAAAGMMSGLQSTVDTMDAIRSRLTSVQAIHKRTEGLFSDYETVKTFEVVRRNIRRTIGDFDRLLTISQRMGELRAMLQMEDLMRDPDLLLHAHSECRRLEQVRDDFVSRLHSDRMLKRFQSFFDDLAAAGKLLEEKLRQAQRVFLVLAKRNPAILIAVVRITEREERHAAVYSTGKEGSFRKAFKHEMKEGLRERFRNAGAKAQSFTERLTAMNFVINDLLIVTDDVVQCFPRNYDLLQWVGRQYHKLVSAAVLEMKAPGAKLQEADVILLLKWTTAYHQQMTDRIGVRDLKPSLQDETEDLLVAVYVDAARDKLFTWLQNLCRVHVSEQETSEEGGKPYSKCVPDMFRICHSQLEVARAIQSGQTTSIVQVYNEIAQACASALTEFVDFWKTALSQKQAFQLPYVVGLANSSLEAIKDLSNLQEAVDKNLPETWQNPQRYEGNLEEFYALGTAAINALVRMFMDDLDSTFQTVLSEEWVRNRSFDVVAGTMTEYRENLKQMLLPQLFKRFVTRAFDEIIGVYLNALFVRKSKPKVTVMVADALGREVSGLQQLLAGTGVKLPSAVKKLEVLVELREFLSSGSDSIAAPCAALVQLGCGFDLEGARRLLALRTDLDKAHREEADQQCVIAFESLANVPQSSGKEGASGLLVPYLRPNDVPVDKADKKADAGAKKAVPAPPPVLPGGASSAGVGLLRSIFSASPAQAPDKKGAAAAAAPSGAKGAASAKDTPKQAPPPATDELDDIEIGDLDDLLGP